MTLAVVAALTLSAALPLPTAQPRFTAAMRRVDANPADRQTLRISLQLRDRSALERLIALQRDPTSPEYRRWLSPAEFGERFGQSEVDYAALLRHLRGAGLKVTGFRNRLYLEAEGSVTQVSRLLGVQLLDVTDEGHRFRSFQGTPRLPGRLGPMILDVEGLDTRHRFAPRLWANGANALGPQDLRRYYDIDALHALGYGGQLSSVAVVGPLPVASTPVSLANVAYFYQAVSDSSAVPVLDPLPLGSSQPDALLGAHREEEVDLEMPTVAAPLLKTVTLVQAPPDSLFVSGYNEVNENLPATTAVSTSFGTCELAELDGGSTGELQAVANAVAQGATQGIAYFAASGDRGAADCQGLERTFVDFPASVPYVVAVGGTMYTGPFDTDHAITAYGDESAWNEDAGTHTRATGGGSSILFAQPTYQSAPGTTDGGSREVPDIALMASVPPGLATVDTLPGQISNNSGGTSAAAALAAGTFALVNDYVGGCGLGSPAAELYTLFRQQWFGGPAVFHDIVTGTNSVGNVVGFAAGPGYDEATGLGSLDVMMLAASWPRCTAAQPDGGTAFLDGGVGFADAGSRLAYAPCAAIGCGGATSCVVTMEGPAQCLTPCNPDVAGACSAGNQCIPVDGGWACTSGCPGGLDGCLVPCDPAALDSCGAGALCAGGDGGGLGACVAGCSTSSDCLEGEACWQGACALACDPDVAAGTCGIGFYCAVTGDGGACTRGCQLPSECSSTQLCIGGQCTASCDAAAANTCGLGFYCVPSYFGGVCTPGCAITSDCPTGQLCLGCLAACVSASSDAGAVGSPCTADLDCQAGGECLTADAGFPGGSCTQVCTGACTCGEGATCLADLGACAPTCSVAEGGPCRAGYVCDPQNSTDQGACLPACASNADCNAFEGNAACDTALGGLCIPPGVSPSTANSSSSGSTLSSTSSSGSAGTGSATSSSGGSGAQSQVAGTTTGGASDETTPLASASSGSDSGSSPAGSPRPTGCACGQGAGGSPMLLFLAVLVDAGQRRRSRRAPARVQLQ